MEALSTAILVLLYCVCSTDSKLAFDDGASIDNIENLIQYEYKYKVDDGSRRGPVMDRWERRLGEYVKGAYSVLQPDGAIRTVDYEVDGDKGYRAITRLTPQVFDYLSYQQLSQADDVIPNSSIPAQSSNSVPLLAPPEPGSSQDIINYHSKPPYINKREFKDHKASASTNLATAIAQRNHPRTPANYNVPFKHSQQLIYYKVPAGKIIPSVRLPQNIFDIDAVLPSQPNWMNFMYKQGITDIVTRKPETIKSNPVKRNSRLVKRFRSMNDVYS